MATAIAHQQLTTSANRLAKVMGTDAHVIVVAEDADYLAEVAIERLTQLEARWSRFRPDSEISRLNERPNVPVLVAPETFQLIAHALEGWRMTEGNFDPTILPELCAEGYDRTFELLTPPEASSRQSVRGDDHGRTQNASARTHAPDIRLDQIVGSVQLGPSTSFDPGGIGKGFAADLVVAELLSSGARGALVSVGGDLRAAGETPDGGSWVVAIVDPLDPDHVVGKILVKSGAVASSWRTKRTWAGSDGRTRHHIIDPRTGRSTANDVAGVTVVAAQGWRAEVLAKGAFLAGPVQGAALIAASGAAGLVIGVDGTVHPAGDIDAFLAPVGEVDH